ncbi:MAG: glycosyltransferase [Gemmatimonadales bacterium]
MSAAPMLSVIVPVYNGRDVFSQCLTALAASDLPREFWELVVVDDASRDDSVERAVPFADTIARLGPRPAGPSYARNRGAEVARGEVLVFIDADVCVHPDTLRRFAWAFAEDPTLAAVFGSYDDRPAAEGFVSQYRNLLHHYVHQQNAGPAETFWAGCGAVRREAFAEVGMYDEWRFSRPQVEDIELGHRLRDQGYRIELKPEIQGTHLKRWTFRGMITADMKDRGVPWSRILLERDQNSGGNQALNLKLKEKVFTVLAWAGLLPLIPALIWRDLRWLLVSVALALVVLVGNVPLYRFFRRTRGLLFTLGVLPLHLLYYILNGFSVLVAVALHQTIGDPKPSASIQAFAERNVVKWPPVPKRAEAAARPRPPREKTP